MTRKKFLLAVAGVWLIAGSAWAATFYVEAVGKRDIVDEEKFKAGCRK